MQLSQKQKIGQQILANHLTLRFEKITLMYTARQENRLLEKPCIIVSISKKTAPKAVQRNYIKRVLRALLRQNIPAVVLHKYDWMWISKQQVISKEQRISLEKLLKAIQ